MDITVKGLRHPHRYVLDAAQTHIYMLMKKVGGVWWGLCCRSLGARKPLRPQAPRKFFRYGRKKGDAMWLLLCWCWDAESSTVSSTCPLGRNLLEPPTLAGWGGPVVDAVCVFLGASFSAVVVLAIMTLIVTVFL